MLKKQFSEWRIIFLIFSFVADIFGGFFAPVGKQSIFFKIPAPLRIQMIRP